MFLLKLKTLTIKNLNRNNYFLNLQLSETNCSIYSIVTKLFSTVQYECNAFHKL